MCCHLYFSTCIKPTIYTCGLSLWYLWILLNTGKVRELFFKLDDYNLLDGINLAIYLSFIYIPNFRAWLNKCTLQPHSVRTPGNNQSIISQIIVYVSAILLASYIFTILYQNTFSWLNHNNFSFGFSMAIYRDYTHCC